MTKLNWILAASAAVLATPALAQDGDDWTGPYVGVSAGYNATKSDSSGTLGGNWSVQTQAHRDAVTGGLATSQSVNAASFGGQIGYNAQVGSNFVLGIEADAAYLTGKDTAVRGPVTVPNIANLTYTFTSRIDPEASAAVKAKAGFAMGPTLVYATGGWGWTWAKVGTDITSSQNYRKTSSLDHTFDGWVAGGGIEHKFSDSISARLDYTYADQGDVTYQTAYVTGSANQTPAFGEIIRQDLRMHQVRVGLNVHF